jgi:hypothetical protein
MYKDKKNYRNKYIDLSYGKHASPRGGRRACLCWDEETYRIECCDGSLRAQGIGSITA